MNEVNLHWFSGSFEAVYLDQVKVTIEEFVDQRSFDNGFEILEWDIKAGLNGYQQSLRWESYIFITYDLEDEYCKRIHNGKASIIFTGDFFDKFGYDVVKDFAGMIDQLGISVTRFDMYYQDEARTVEIIDILSAYKKGCMRGFRTERYIDSNRNGLHTGETIEFGKRGAGSGKFLRIYDKELESKGEVKGIRWEVEWSSKRAINAWDILQKAEFNRATIAGMIFATIDFVEPTHDSNRSRWKRLEWYEMLIESAELVLVPSPKYETNIDKKVGWLNHSVVGTLSYVRAFFCMLDGTSEGFEGMINQMANEGRDKLTKAHYRQLAEDIRKYREDHNDPGPMPTPEEIEQFCELEG